MPSFERYTKTAVVLHWVIAALLLAEFAQGWWMQQIPKQPPGIRADAFNLHKSIGLLLLALALIRLGWRLAHRPPKLATVPRWQALLAKANHGLLYAMMIAMPLTGYLGSVFSGYPIKWFGVTLPGWASSDPLLKEAMSIAHLATSWILLASLCLHAAAPVKLAVAGDRVLAGLGFGADPGRPAARRDAVASPRP
jgi:cytochrome b561